MGVVTSVGRSPRHGFSKEPVAQVRLLAGRGVEGDAHCGETVQHRSIKRWRPQTPNLRQVHLLDDEVLDALRGRGFVLGHGDIGENVATTGVGLLGLPVTTRLHLGDEAVVELTGLRNPCVQLDRFADGLRAAVLERDEAGGLVRKAGVMAVVVTGGVVSSGDAVRVALPELPHQPLERV